MSGSVELARTGRIGPAGRSALQLLAHCPHMPTDVLGVLLDHAHPATTAQLLARLNTEGLVRYQEIALGPLLGETSVRLWTLRAEGRGLLTTRRVAPAAGDALRMAYGQPDLRRDPARQRGVPMLVACYRMLATIAAAAERPVRVCGWEFPWIRTLGMTESGRTRRLRLPAAAVVQTGPAACPRLVRVFLLPDVGTTPLSSYRPMLRALVDLRRTTRVENDDEPLLVIGIATSEYLSSARAHAWRCLLRDVAARVDDRPPHALVLQSPKLAIRGASRGRRPSHVDEVFALVARHPLLTRQQVAVLLRTSARRIARLEAALVQRGWLCPVAVNVQPPVTRTTARQRTHQLGMVELTPAGQQEANRRLLVSAESARRRHGVTASDATRRGFVRHLQHTLGANAFFVDLAAAAARMTSRGSDEALAEWRSAAACARGWFRPDGYGCYRRGTWRFGFFLEYDRGTERPAQYATKLARYYRYRHSGAYRRDYDTFPTVLIVTVSELAEFRLAQQAELAIHQFGGLALSMFLATTDRIHNHPDGILGPVWRVPGHQWSPTRSSYGGCRILR